eukprot:gene14093-17226_t
MAMQTGRTRSAAEISRLLSAAGFANIQISWGFRPYVTSVVTAERGMPQGTTVKTSAVILSGPRNLSVGQLGLTSPSAADVVVEVAHSGISTGTEKLFWSGTMPPFPGMGYPLVPGYEAAGEVVEAGTDSGFCVGDHVFVPGANCFEATESGPVRGLFG